MKTEINTDASTGFTLEELDKMRCRMRPFPLPPDSTPTCRVNFRDIPDKIMLEVPPHLIAHMQRTAAQGGLQIVSPRQTPLSSLMRRINSERRILGDHIVGSVADQDDEWPTIDDTDFSSLLPDEPLPSRASDPALRTKTRTKALTTATHMMSDPILSCLVKGRAVADILDRDDVQGDSSSYIELLADAWGVEKEQLMDLDAFSLGYDGDLLRHAIRVDDVFPTMHAPVHQKLSISVGSNEVTREALPPDTAMDWRRMRVFCEAVFSMSLSIEGIPLKSVRASPPPGDMGAPGNRKDIMAFQPSPCTAWTYSPETFSISPVISDKLKRKRVIPAEVYNALTKYIEGVRPVSYAMGKGFRPHAKTTHLEDSSSATGESIQGGYHLATRRVTVSGARGKTASATVRNYIFEVIESMRADDAMRLSRYIQIAKSEVATHLSLPDVPEEMIDELARKFLTVGEKVRLKVVAEATLRGHTSEEWWRDITSQTAMRYKEMKEGTMGWARVAIYMLFKQPTDKWRKLCSALNFSVMRAAAVTSVGGIALPPEKESAARIEAAARHVSKSVSRTYAGHYLGVADVGRAMANYLAARGKDRSAETMRQASYLWALRARVFRATNVSLMPKDTEKKNLNHYLAKGKTVCINLAPAPYRMYAAYRMGVVKSELIPKRVHAMLPEKLGGRVSEVFQKMNTPILPAKESELTKYLLRPNILGGDMEKAWRELTEDMAKVLQTYEPKDIQEEPMREVVMMASSDDVLVAPIARVSTSGRREYFDIIAELEGEAMDYVDSLIDAIGEDRADLVMEDEYSSVDELVNTLLGIKSEVEAERSSNLESVR